MWDGNLSNELKGRKIMGLSNIIRFFKRQGKSSIIIEYDTCQSQSGKLYHLDIINHFEKIQITGNRLVVYTSDNGLTKNGRIGAQYNLDNHSVSFLSQPNNKMKSKKICFY